MLLSSPYIKYKEYSIEPRVICFDIRYVIHGGDNRFACEYFKDIIAAKKAIDKHIARKFIDKLLESTSVKLGVDKNIIIEVLSNIIAEG